MVDLEQQVADRVNAAPRGVCRHELCTATYSTHYWGKVRAHDEGWFMQKDGTSWCPAHNPPWVAAWRGSKR